MDCSFRIFHHVDDGNLFKPACWEPKIAHYRVHVAPLRGRESRRILGVWLLSRGPSAHGLVPSAWRTDPGTPIAVEDVLNARMIAYPFRPIGNRVGCPSQRAAACANIKDPALLPTP